jgi:ABC-2 type transport system ATP-binding protein
LIEVKNLSKEFGETKAVDNISFNVKKGEIFGFLGPNGAGKTSTIRMLSCLISSSSGEAKINGYNINNKQDREEIRKIIGLVPDNVGLYNELTAYENLKFYGKLYGISSNLIKENIKYFLKMFEIWDKRNIVVEKFSKGMKQKLAITRALLHNPPILFLDEPTANLDPESSKKVRDFLIKLKNEEKTIFLNTHNLNEASEICDKVGIMNTKLMKVSSPKKLEESIWGKKIVIQLKEINSTILDALNNLNFKNIVNTHNKITIEVNDPDNENPIIVDKIVNAGGKIQYLNKFNPSLEDTYFKILGSEK